MEGAWKGSEGGGALLQTVLRLTEESDWRREVGGISELLGARRGETVAGLSSLISRMRDQLQLKKEMEPLLEKAQDAWKEMMLANEKLMTEIRRLGKENEELSEKVKVLEGQVAEREKRGEESGSRIGEESLMSNSNVATTSAGQNRKRTHSNISKSRLDASFAFASSMSLAQSLEGEEEGRGEEEALNSDSQQVPANSTENFVLLTENPYDSLNPEYYNPTQFFQRLSTGTARRGRGRGGRGGAGGSKGGKKAKEGASGKEKSKTKKKRARKQPESESPIEILYETSEGCGDGNQVVLAEAEGKEDGRQFPEAGRGAESSHFGVSSEDGEESTGYFDYHTPPSYLEDEEAKE